MPTQPIGPTEPTQRGDGEPQRIREDTDGLASTRIETTKPTKSSEPSRTSTEQTRRMVNATAFRTNQSEKTWQAIAMLMRLTN